MNDYEVTVGIYSEENALTAKLKDKLVENDLNCKVFTSLKDINKEEISYLVVNLLDASLDEINLKELFINSNYKILVLFPQMVKKEELDKAENRLNYLLTLNPSTGIILTPEIIGEGVSYKDDYVSHQIIKQSLLGERIKIGLSKESINLISVNQLANIILKELFSFGVSGKRLLLRGITKKVSVLTSKYMGVSKQNVLLTKSNDWVEIQSDMSLNASFSLSLAVSKTRKSFLRGIEEINREDFVSPKENLANEKVLIPTTSFPRTRKVSLTWPKFLKFNVKPFVKVLSVIVFLMFTPLILTVISAVLLLAAAKISLSNTALAEKITGSSIFLSGAAKSISFQSTFYYSFANITYQTGNLAKEGFLLVDTGKELVASILGDETYDINNYSTTVSASLDNIHTKIGFLQSDLENFNNLLTNYLVRLFESKDLDIVTVKEKIYNYKNITSRLGVLLGSPKPKKYLVLFQNNMELRPTGGFIGSFALVTFEKGRLTEIVVNDVYSADGQLKGHVDPPEPIRVHLGEGGWYLRDSNWDPDFKVSSSKAEWFLDKEMDVKVDGVIAIDLYFIQSLLKITGPITLNDYNKVITSENLYQTTQSEVESEFFAGSIKKASFLTSLSRNLITEIENLNPDRHPALLKEIYKNLDERHIQLVLHDTNAQEALSNLNYSGEIDLSTECGQRCLNDKHMLVDANLGINKANYFMRRMQEVTITPNKENISHELIATYQNNASLNIGQSGSYKSYTRVLIPKEAVVGGVRVFENGGAVSDVNFDLTEINGRREVGFLVELLPSTIKRFQIVWNLPTEKLGNGGELRIKAIKQGGTDMDSLKVNINQGELQVISSKPAFTLTGKTLSSYNTALGRDFTAQVYLK